MNVQDEFYYIVAVRRPIDICLSLPPISGTISKGRQG